MNSFELREKYLDFFKSKKHAIIPCASLVPENDPTVLFTTAGMHPLVPFLLGEKHPAGKRLANIQKCIRTGDINEVGDDTHLTFFEMLGNWSLGDYWKKEAIEWSFEFLTKKLKISKERLAVSCFAGDKDASKDLESAEIWESLGIKKERIAFLPKEDNWWGPAGQTGPCGPDTEMFYWKSDDLAVPAEFDPNDKRWVEIWNNVLMQYVKNEKGEYKEAQQKNVDTGMGLERTLAALNNQDNVYDTDLFLPIIKKIEEIASGKYKDNIKAYRIIADHIKAATFILSEKVEPSNIERGYVLRRLIRRAIRYGKQLGIKDGFTHKIALSVIDIYGEVYSEVKDNKDFIEDQLRKEEEKFEKTLERGLKEFENIKTDKVISAKDAFNLYQTYGFPIEITEELAKEKDMEVDLGGFKKELEKHQELSRTASAGVFKGGLADASIQTTKLHTAAHLMLAALRKVLGEKVIQRGSNITAERLRFDFSFDRKLNQEELKKVEDLVNQAIEKDLSVKFEEVSLGKAKEMEAMGVFESKYGEVVKVYTIGDNKETVSREICGGPHVDRIGILGRFEIQKEESSSSGVRRIKAVLK